jgi:2-hydroxychromene-2-carboxylate isomerase
MTSQPEIEFWYEFASTYSYPAAMTISARAEARGVRVVWRPFMLGPIFVAQGWKGSPFNIYPAKGRYMWRDVERLCAAEGLPFVRPEIFPQHTILAARLALVLSEQGLTPDYTRRVYHAQFAEGRDVSEAGLLSGIISDLGADADAAVAEAGKDALKQRMRDIVAEAQARGIFGAPTFMAGDEMFWGFDRMDAALDWVAGGQNG